MSVSDPEYLAAWTRRKALMRTCQILIRLPRLSGEKAFNYLIDIARIQPQWANYAAANGLENKPNQLLKAMMSKTQYIVNLVADYAKALTMVHDELTQRNHHCLNAVNEHMQTSEKLSGHPLAHLIEAHHEVNNYMLQAQLERAEAGMLHVHLTAWTAEHSPSPWTTQQYLVRLLGFAMRTSGSLSMIAHSTQFKAVREDVLYKGRISPGDVMHLVEDYDIREDEEQTLRDIKLGAAASNVHSERQGRLMPQSMNASHASGRAQYKPHPNLKENTAYKSDLRSHIARNGGLRFPELFSPGRMCGRYHMTGHCPGGFKGCYTKTNSSKPLFYSHLCACKDPEPHPLIDCMNACRGKQYHRPSPTKRNYNGRNDRNKEDGDDDRR